MNFLSMEKSSMESGCVQCTTCVIYTPTLLPAEIKGLRSPTNFRSNSRVGSSACSSEQGFAHHSSLCYQHRGLRAKGQVCDKHCHQTFLIQTDPTAATSAFAFCSPHEVHTALATLFLGVCTALTSHTLPV